MKASMKLCFCTCWMPLSKTLASSWASDKGGRRNGGWTWMEWGFLNRPVYLHTKTRSLTVRTVPKGQTTSVFVRKKDCEPGSLRAAKNVCNVFQTPVRKRVNATPELSSHLRVKRWQLNNLHISIIVYTHTRQTHTHTCSLVVLPLATRTKWNPVSPATGTRNKPATHITAILSEVLRIPMELNRFTVIFNVASITYKEFWQANLKIKKLYQLQWTIKH